MGVMSCSRRSCKNIMCDTYVPAVGYVCNECQEEFKNFIGHDIQTEGAMKMQLKNFMTTPKGTFNIGQHISVEDFFKQYTKSSW